MIAVMMFIDLCLYVLYMVLFSFTHIHMCMGPSFPYFLFLCRCRPLMCRQVRSQAAKPSRSCNVDRTSSSTLRAWAIRLTYEAEERHTGNRHPRILPLRLCHTHNVRGWKLDPAAMSASSNYTLFGCRRSPICFWHALCFMALKTTECCVVWRSLVRGHRCHVR